MPGSFTIRPPQSSREWEAVKSLLRDYYNEFDDKTCFTSFDEEMSHIEKLYADPDKYKLIAVEDSTSQVMGCVAYRAHAPGVAEMKRLYVDPAYRGHRLGKLLAEKIIEKARELGFHTMILDTMVEMKVAQQLYRQLGFQVMTPYNQQDESKVVCYEKILTV